MLMERETERKYRENTPNMIQRRKGMKMQDRKERSKSSSQAQYKKTITIETEHRETRPARESNINSTKGKREPPRDQSRQLTV